MQEKEQQSCNQERRNLLKGAGKIAAGAALVSAGAFTLPQLAKAKAAAQQWPWPYEKLDPAKTAELCYNEWYRVFCGCAVINSVFKQLAEKVGEPYSSFPSDAFVYLEGGHVGWGTICGSPAGAAMVVNCIAGPRIAGSPVGHHMTEDILQWYSEASMPVFTPANPKITAELVKTTSESPLCHVSVGKWMKAANKPIGSPERKDRCARVAASTAYRVVEMLNAWKDGKYEPKSTHAPVKDFGITAQMNCMECHGNNVPTPPMAKK
ncbi:MAG: C-GCAxxG-C-C family (seleno)protein [Thermodesulfobacteriota bacterium]